MVVEVMLETEIVHPYSGLKFGRDKGLRKTGFGLGWNRDCSARLMLELVERMDYTSHSFETVDPYNSAAFAGVEPEVSWTADTLPGSPGLVG